MENTCRVWFRAHDGIEHACEVTARSIYEAAGFAIARFRACAEFNIDPTQEITIEPRTPSVSHTITRKQFDEWLNKPGTGSPREQSIKFNVREALAKTPDALTPKKQREYRNQ